MEDSGVIRAMGGPKENPLQLRIVTGMFVDGLESSMVEKELPMQDRANRKADDEFVQQQRARLFQGHQDVGGMNSMEFTGITTAMMKSDDGQTL